MHRIVEQILADRIALHEGYVSDAPEGPFDAEGLRVADTAATLAASLTILSPEEEEALLHEAGFREVRQFYAALTLRGWVAYR